MINPIMDHDLEEMLKVPGYPELHLIERIKNDIKPPYATLLDDGGAVFLDQKGEQISRFQVYGWKGIHLFVKKYPSAPLKIQKTKLSTTEEINKFIENIKEPEAARWIYCEDQMPEKNERVKAVIADGTLIRNRVWFSSAHGGWIEAKDRNDWGAPCRRKITKWFPFFQGCLLCKLGNVRTPEN